MSDPVVYLFDHVDADREALTDVLSRNGVPFLAFDRGTDLLMNLQPDRSGCLVLGLNTPNTNAFDLFRRIRDCDSCRPCLFITDSCAVCDATSAMRMGAIDVLVKPLDPDVFLARVHEAFEMDEDRRSRKAALEKAQSRIRALTVREKEVLELVVAGRLTKQIAKQLSISAKTVDVHRSNIVRKLQVDSIAQLVRVVMSSRSNHFSID
tara:strand:- start:3858 stop:4481 length:624 start_codon:yes stop_codon:yes gene_type:complete